MKQFYKNLAEDLNSAAEARQVEKEFSLAKKYSALKSGNKTTISKERLKQHFENHFSARAIPLPPELENPQNYPYLEDEKIPINEGAPTEKETRDAKASFKDNKSFGTDRLKTEGLKYNSSNTLVARIHLLLVLIWSTLMVPTAWLHAYITCLYKKGSQKDPVNYRGISIGANMSRILSKIIVGRIKEAYEKHISEAQFGFRRNRSTTDGIFILRNVLFCFAPCKI